MVINKSITIIIIIIIKVSYSDGSCSSLQFCGNQAQ